ncbi:MAG: DUF512 domain-containing protein [Firmicutes bacterium]|nr:DUF512 domain-containing protein [Bacillota bacterium]
MLRVARAAPAGIGWELGIAPGDKILTINGNKVNDILDYHFHINCQTVAIEILSANGELTVYDIEKDYDDDLDLEFDFVTRSCANKCVFCFIDQQPPGMRQTLYVKDDDYRLSFLHGNYVTLTNLSEKDLARIIDEHLSPLYISIHATDPTVRRAMLGKDRGRNLVEILERLAANGILFHGQIVLCPGYNDGQVLEQTLSDLLTMANQLLSLAIVPVGLTKHRQGLPQIPSVDPQTAQTTIELADTYRERFYQLTGRRTVYIADEIFLLSGRTVPERKYYEDFSQLENGVGMVRKTLMDLETVAQKPKYKSSFQRVLLLTGTLAAPVLTRAQTVLEAKLAGLELTVKGVENRFLGKTITVAGLLSGSDIIRTLKGESRPPDLLVVPGTAVRAGCFVDDYTLDELTAVARCQVEARETILDLFELLAGGEE